MVDDIDLFEDLGIHVSIFRVPVGAAYHISCGLIVLAGGEMDHLLTLPDQPIRQVGANQPTASCDQRCLFHCCCFIN